MIFNMVDSHGNWVWDQLSQHLPDHILDKIAMAKQPQHLGSDILGWRWENNRRFTTKSTYHALGHDDMSATNVERVRRHLAISDECGICHGGSESVDHVLHDCIKAQNLWLRVISPDNRDAVLILHGKSNALVGSSLIDAIVKLLNRSCCTMVRHINRERNKVVDRFAMLSRGGPIGMCSFLHPPFEVTTLVLDDMPKST
ncbi:hypothetical protein V6N11_009361 [Hibiscus sabdariffa]|uniref:Reverse transcriptase zinc-binding domain-containing protein n=1 Tax=Hibiscus sabdariffa TaxID=183260 RepID=A0ABR2NSJ8_9ROSI